MCPSEHQHEPHRYRPRVQGPGDPVGAAADRHAEQEEGGGGARAAATHPGGDGEGEEEEGGGGAAPQTGRGGQKAVSGRGFMLEYFHSSSLLTGARVKYFCFAVAKKIKRLSSKLACFDPAKSHFSVKKCRSGQIHLLNTHFKRWKQGFT